MSKERVILKSYKESRDEEILVEYGHMLEKSGWRLAIMEGGYLSPDGSTLFIFGRSPYHGQLLQFLRGREVEYYTLVQKLMDLGDFVRY